MKKILIPLPAKDFDPTEVAIPWKILSSEDVQIIFATPEGRVAEADFRMLNGVGLGIWSIFLKADKNAQKAYQAMANSKEFTNPIRWTDISVDDFTGVLLPGGHAKGMKVYLESSVLQKVVASFFEQDKLVGAICHGVVLAARSQNKNGQSVLFNKKTTALLKTQELLAWALTRLWLGDYYRTYPITVEDEVVSVLSSKQSFIKGPLPLFRDSIRDLNNGFCVVDGNYISARWPGDAHTFALEYLKLFQNEN